MKTSFTLKTLLIALLIVNSASSNAQTKTNPLWTVTSSSVKFKIKNAKLNVDGTFKDLVATIFFDAFKNEGNSIEAKINVNTINTGVDMRDSHIKKAEYFDVAKSPEIKIKSNSITKVKDNQYSAKCTLTIKGKSKEVVIPFTFTEKDNKGVFTGTFTINRLDFGVGSSSVIMSNNVEIFISINATKK